MSGNGDDKSRKGPSDRTGEAMSGKEDLEGNTRDEGLPGGGSREPADPGTATGGHRDDGGHAPDEKGRSRKSGRVELAELLSRKNEILQDMEKRMEETEQELARKEDRLLRLAAEFENYRKRTSREWELHKQKANAELMTSLLGILDDFDRAFDAGEGADEHFREGISLIRASLLDVLSRNGLEPIDAEGKEFDPQYHEAMGEMESENVEKGHVAEVVQKGYMLKDQVLRPSRVIVSRGSGE